MHRRYSRVQLLWFRFIDGKDAGVIFTRNENVA